jgi:hypothetical protein
VEIELRLLGLGRVMLLCDGGQSFSLRDDLKLVRQKINGTAIAKDLKEEDRPYPLGKNLDSWNPLVNADKLF